MSHHDAPGTPPSRRNRVHHVNLDPARPGDHDTRLQAAIDASGVKPGDRALVYGTRVGDAEHVPPGYALAPCIECGSQVWVNAMIAQTYPVDAVCIDHLG